MAVQDADIRTEVCDCPPRQYETCDICKSVTSVTPSPEVERLRTELRVLRMALRETVGWDDGVGTDIELVDAVNDWRTSALLLADAMTELGEEVRRQRSVNAELVAELEQLRKLEIAALHWNRIWECGVANVGVDTVLHNAVVLLARRERLDELHNGEEG